MPAKTGIHGAYDSYLRLSVYWIARVKPGNDKGAKRYDPSFAFTNALALAKSIWPA